MDDRERLIDIVTRQVMAALAAPPGDRCADCAGACAAHCSDKTRAVVAAGAGRVAFAGAVTRGDGDADPTHGGLGGPGGVDGALGGPGGVDGGRDGRSAAGVPADLAPLIDHTLLRPDATAADVDRLCDEAMAYGFATVCVNPVWVRRAAARVRRGRAGVAAVAGFPLGANTPEIKAAEARRALRDGATEIDMVIQVGALKGGDHALVRRDVAGVVDACREAGATCKVILETALLTDAEKVVACRIARAARAHFVKTSTGFGPGGATVFDVALMREAVGPDVGVKASGGIRSTEDAEAMVRAGATRIGASASVAIVGGAGGGGRGGRH